MAIAAFTASGAGPRRGLRAAAGLSLFAVAGCVADVPDAAVPARSGEHRVAVDGVAFVARIAPGTPGMMLTAEGAKPVAGNTLRISRDGPALAMHEGVVAKKAARAGCAAAGGRFAEQAIGGYDGAGVWSFPGVCA
jgi:hypothetical protein